MARTSGKKSRAKRRALSSRQMGMCYWCQEIVPENEQTLDHIIPKACGGGNEAANLIMSCRNCNVERGCQTAEQYAQSKGRPIPVGKSVAFQHFQREKILPKSGWHNAVEPKPLNPAQKRKFGAGVEGT